MTAFQTVYTCSITCDRSGSDEKPRNLLPSKHTLAQSEKSSKKSRPQSQDRYATTQTMAPSESKSQLGGAPDSQMYTVQEASRLLHVCASLIYTLCSRGKIEHHRYGLGRGTIRISKGALLQYLNYSRVVPKSPPKRIPTRFSQLDSSRLAVAWRKQGVL